MKSAVVLAIVVVPMLAEARLAARNERKQRAKGGVEPPDDVYPAMRIAYPAAFLAMIAEGALRGAAAPVPFAAGLIVFATAKALKWWAIATLGPFWTFRVIVVPGAPLVRSGPYRLLRHPNYAGVIGELVGVALMSGATIAGPVATVLFGILIFRRISIERRALRQAAGADWA